MTVFRRLAVALLLLLVPAIARAQTYTLTPTPFQTAFDDSGRIINNACVWTYAAGTTTAATTFSDTAGTPNLNPIRSNPAGRFTAYLLAGSNYKFVYESACTPPAHSTVLRTADNILGIPGSSATVDVTGTAGESITTSQCVYLSNGSGGKTQGLWYKCDSGNSYSSASAEVGFALAAITSGTAGQIRIAGAVSSLSSLSVGQRYYVSSTAGGVSLTPGAFARFVGQADTPTSLVIGNPGLVPVTATFSPIFLGCGARLTLTSGTPVTTADVTAASTIYVTPYSDRGWSAGVCGFYDGSSGWVTLSFTETAVALGTLTSGLPYDLFCYSNAGTMACDSPVAWTNATTRATALTNQDGVPVKSGATTRRFMGSFYTTSTTTTEDSAAKRDLSNANNKKCRPLRVSDATAGWTYSTNTLRQARATATNQVEAMVAYADATLDLMVQHYAGGDAGAIANFTAIGEDSTTTADTAFEGGLATSGGGGSYSGGNMTGRLVKQPAAGWHRWVWLEKAGAGAGGGNTFGSPGTVVVGLAGCVEN